LIEEVEDFFEGLVRDGDIGMEISGWARSMGCSAKMPPLR
jgi:hypothetical protein